MAKRNRPILYEVFGSQTRVKRWGAPPKKRPAKKPARRKGSMRGAVKELRVSYELAAVIGLLTVVLGGTLYYFGWVRGNDPRSDADPTLQATSSRTELNGGRDTPPPTGRREKPKVATQETYYAVRVFTVSYAEGATREQIQERAKRALAVKDFLVSKGYTDARAIRYAGSRSVVVYVGRADTASALDGKARKIGQLRLDGKKQFSSAYPTKITVRK